MQPHLQTKSFSAPTFGSAINSRALACGEYRFGMNGQEQDNEISGQGNSLNYTFRMFDPRIGRFFAVDPITSEYPGLTPYQHSSLNPIWMLEIEGLEGQPFQNTSVGFGVKITLFTGKSVLQSSQATLGLRMNLPQNSSNNFTPRIEASTTFGLSPFSHTESVVSGSMNISYTQNGGNIGSTSFRATAAVSGFAISGNASASSTKPPQQRTAEAVAGTANPLNNDVNKAFLLFNKDGASFALSRKNTPKPLQLNIPNQNQPLNAPIDSQPESNGSDSSPAPKPMNTGGGSGMGQLHFQELEIERNSGTEIGNLQEGGSF